MKLARGYRPISNQKMKPIKGHPSIGLNRDFVLIITLPCSRILGVILKSLFLVVFVLALPSIGSFVNDSCEENYANGNEFGPIVFEDLAIEGLFKDGQKGLVLGSKIEDLFDGFWFLNDMGIDLVNELDLDRQMVIHDEVFDFVFASSLENAEFINRVVKLDGIVVMPLRNHCDRYNEFLKRSNYKIVYLRRFNYVTVIAMRKTDGEGEEGVFNG